MVSPASDPWFRRASASVRRHVCATPLMAVSGLLLAVSLLFLLAPGLDPAVSGLFYEPSVGFRRIVLLTVVRETGHLMEWALVIAFLAPLAIKFLAPESRLLLRPRTSLFALASLALGPGLIVNGILKEFWGRARPRELVEFGGESDFSPVWWISDQCYRNCSFVSGEAASAFWLVSLAFVVPRAWRPATVVVTLGAAALVSYTRLAQGGHFLSDVLIAWLITLLVMVALHRLVLAGLPPRFDTAAEAAIAEAGRGLRRWLAALPAFRRG